MTVASVVAGGACVLTLLLVLNSRLSRLIADVPNERSLHTVVTPRVGGIGVIVGIAAGWLTSRPPLDVAVIVCLAGLALMSLLDDRFGLPVRVRLGVHGAVAAVFAVVVLGRLDARAVVVALAAVWSINLYNFMDGANGLAGGMAVIGFATCGVAALAADDEGMAAASFTVASAALGFLPFNFPNARVFLGDAGSTTFGFLVAVIGVVGWDRGLWRWWFPTIVFSPFIADATVTLLKRLLRREQVWQAHRTHYYQRLIQLGWGHRKTAVAEYALMILVGVVAILGRERSWLTATALVAVAGVVIGGAGIAVDLAWRRFETGGFR